MPTELTVPADLASCPHDRGPGTAVCLRCRADAHRKAAAARRRLVTRLTVAGMVLLGVVAVAGSGAIARVPSLLRTPPSEPRDASPAGAESFRVPNAVAAETGHAPVAVAAPATPIAPLVAEGRTPLPQGMYAERAGDSVAVHFDSPLLRTRRREKFEQVVRATLPALYGAVADSALASVAEGELASRGDLLRELPARGVALPPRDGWAITLWPVTRPGQDGPLVVSYRVSVGRAR